MSARILLVEDDPALLSVLRAAIAFGGFSEESAASGREAIALFERERFDAVLVDLGLPDLDGTEVLLSLRRLSDVPIIVVSGRGGEHDKIALLDLGADDYIAKPFLPGELLARIRAALRRHRASGAPGTPRAEDDRDPIRAGALTLDPFHRTIGMGAETALLTDGEFTVLKALIQAAGTFVAKETLLRALYCDEEPPAETRIVEVYISNIRRKLRGLCEDELILNARGRGWKLELPA
ncbi:response regulator transcription factor [Sphingomonas parva]|nr:response regulator transcription factor [Sphingomonas parva]